MKIRRLIAATIVSAGATSATGAWALSVPADGAWHWFDSSTPQQVTGLTCLDGSATGFAVDVPAGGGNGRLMIYLEGGGGCWDGSTAPCKTPPLPPLGFVATTSYPFSNFQSEMSGTGDINFTTPFLWAKPQLAASGCTANCSGRGIFDRSTGPANNPFANYTYVFVPYCSGDLWQGSNTDTHPLPFRHAATVTNQAGTVVPATFHGAVNFANVMAYVKATFPAPPSIVLIGGSAGGMGTFFNYGALRAAYPTTAIPVTVISDSAGGFWTGTPNPLLPSTWTRNGYFLHTPATAPTASYLEDYWADAWNSVATAQSLYPGLATTQPAGSHAPFCRQQDIYLAAAAMHPTVDKFGMLMGSADWLIPSFFNLQTNPLFPSLPGASPNTNDAINDILINVVPTHSNVFALNVSSTLTPAPALNVALGGLRPWSEHHTHLLDDVTLWTPMLAGGNGLLGFFQSMSIPSN